MQEKDDKDASLSTHMISFFFPLMLNLYGSLVNDSRGIFHILKPFLDVEILHASVLID